jgi:nucleotidyltransferase AbiEii toxin of type IV toxin-antitoxin system
VSCCGPRRSGWPTSGSFHIEREILANKLTAIVGRAEKRDLIDVMLLERAGYSIEAALPAALAKDGGCIRRARV